MTLKTLIGSSSYSKFKLQGPNQNKKYLKWRQPQMEDDLKISKVKDLSNKSSDFPQILNWPYLSQILNWSSGDQTEITTKPNQNKKKVEMKTTSNIRRPQNIKSRIPQNLNLRLEYQIKIKECLTWRQPPMEDDLKILNMEYLSNH